MLNSGIRSTTSLTTFIFLDSSTILSSPKLKKGHSLVESQPEDKMAWSGTSQDQVSAPEESENYLLTAALEPQLVSCGEPGMSLHHHQKHQLLPPGHGLPGRDGSQGGGQPGLGDEWGGGLHKGHSQHRREGADALQYV